VGRGQVGRSRGFFGGLLADAGVVDREDRGVARHQSAVEAIPDLAGAGIEVTGDAGKVHLVAGLARDAEGDLVGADGIGVARPRRSSSTCGA